MAQEDKLKELDAALAQIEKQFGKGSVMKLGDSGANMNIETVPTGSLSLDIALGLGGIPVSYTHLSGSGRTPGGQQHRANRKPFPCEKYFLPVFVDFLDYFEDVYKRQDD